MILKYFRNRKLFRDFISCVRENRYDITKIKKTLKELPDEVIRKIGKEIIYSDYNGFNDISLNCSLSYFDNLSRWQKEFFIVERLYILRKRNYK